MPYCIKCGNQLAPNANYCHFCGTPVAPKTSPAETRYLFKVATSPRVVVRNESPGSVEVRAGNEGEVAVNFDLKEQDYLDWVALQNGDVITVTCRLRSGAIWPAYFPLHGARSNISVVLPRQANVNASCRFGGITVSGVQGTTFAESDAGSIQFRDCNGSVDARTKTGSIELEQVNGAVSARNYAGSISFSGNLSGGESWFRTKAGNIDVSLSGEPDLSIDAITRVGRVTLDPDLKAVQSQSEQYVVSHRVYCMIGKGTNKLHAETYTGAISVRKART